MADTDVNEGAVGESSRLIDRAQPAVLEMRELHRETITENPDISATDAKLNTALHRAVVLVCGNSNKHAASYKKLEKLMTNQNIKLNIPNKEGYTAMGCAVEYGQKNCVKYMLKHPSSHNLYLDYYPGDRESTVMEIIKEMYPELESLLPAPLMENLHSTDSDKQLLAALQRDKFKAFRKRLNQTNANIWYNEPYYSYILEIACQMKKRNRFIRLLLDSGAKPNIKNRVTGTPLLHATARSGNFGLLQVLLNKEETDVSLKDDKDRTILHWLAQVRERKPGDKYILENCFKLLLHKNSARKIGIDWQDVRGNTALYVALQNGFRDRATLLLNEGADVSLLGNASQALLPTILPTLEEILDDCLLPKNELLMSKNFEFELNYQLLMHIVPHIAECQYLRELLKHPVISTFLSLKWLKVRFIFSLYIFLYLAFLSFLTSYILYSESYHTLNNADSANNFSGNFSSNDSSTESGMNYNSFTSQTHDSNMVFLWLSLIVLWFLLTLLAIMQLIVHGRVYVFSLENWLEISLLIATFISCFGVVESAELKLHSSAVALLLGWSELLLMSGRLPLLSVQFEMLRTVTFTFLTYMMGYVTLFIAFALSFHILFKENSDQVGNEMFANPFVSLLKTIVMFTGEFDASDLSFDTFPYTSHVIFLLFVVLVAIVLLNLLNGLAVGDTGEIRRDAETLSLVARAKLIDRIERMVNAIPKFIKPALELKKEMFVINPNERNRIGSAAVRTLWRIIIEKPKRHEKGKSAECPNEWRVLTKKFSDLELRQKKVEKKLYSKLDESRQILEKILARLNTREYEITDHEFSKVATTCETNL